MTLAELYPAAVARLATQPVGRPIVISVGRAWLAARHGGAGQIEASWRASWRDALDDARGMSRLPIVEPWSASPRGQARG